MTFFKSITVVSVAICSIVAVSCSKKDSGHAPKSENKVEASDPVLEEVKAQSHFSVVLDAQVLKLKKPLILPQSIRELKPGAETIYRYIRMQAGKVTELETSFPRDNFALEGKSDDGSRVEGDCILDIKYTGSTVSVAAGTINFKSLVFNEGRMRLDHATDRNMLGNNKKKTQNEFLIEYAVNWKCDSAKCTEVEGYQSTEGEGFRINRVVCYATAAESETITTKAMLEKGLDSDHFEIIADSNVKPHLIGDKK